MRKQTTALFFWNVPEKLRSYLRENLHALIGLDLVFPEPANYEEYCKLVPSANILVGWRPKKELLDLANKLDLFINPGAGVNHLIPLFKEINERKTILLINGHGNSYFTAQHAVALYFSVANKIIQHHQWMKKGLWRRGDSFAKSMPLQNKIIGILGYGAIGKKIHQFLSGFDVEFAILKSNWSDNDNLDKILPNHRFSKDQLNEFMKIIDILFVAVPHTKETDNLITLNELENLNSNVIIINVARGAVINQNDFFYILKENLIAGAGIDVWYDYSPKENINGEKYPYDPRCPFHQLENVVLSPHRGASPMDNLQRWDEVIENIKRYHQEKNHFLNVVDLEREY